MSLHLFALEEGEYVAICQLRGRHNFEKKGKPESWAGGLQPAAHGKLEDTDDCSPLDAIVRECREELQLKMPGDLPHGFTSEHLDLNGVRHFTVRTSILTIRECVRLHPSSGGLILLCHSDLDRIKNLKEFPKDSVLPSDTLAMFLDDLQAMRTFWDKLQQ